MSRTNYLTMQQNALLCDWAARVRQMFRGEMCYQVGSSLTRKDFRDVDVRLIMDDADYDALAHLVNIDRLNLSVSIWGNHVTQLPIDFQVQRMTDANAEFAGMRNALFYLDDPTYDNREGPAA
ncbi:hypothetical protein ACQP1O_42985 (plasmid) [Nocardia sp. CA-151230]|uniref:hypothetical protein n=1 Tax=Nocardia sp. CA-151230 TaxID=3239982 RepID=UPI003D92CE2F